MAERALRPTLLYAGIEVSRQIRWHGRDPDAAIKYLLQGSAQVALYDYGGATLLADRFGWGLFSHDLNPGTAFSQTIERWLRAVAPIWRDLLPLGRQKLLDMLDENERACFEIAGLLGHEREVLDWWDRMAAETRAAIDDRLLELGREAERRSLERETALLAGTGLTPAWVSVEDNTAGYDIKTFRETVSNDPGGHPTAEWREHHVEVKYAASISIHLSAGEWRHAEAHADRWELQIWRKGQDEPLSLGVAEVREHVAANRGAGSWESLEIPVEALLATTPAEEVLVGNGRSFTPTGPHRETSDSQRIAPA